MTQEEERVLQGATELRAEAKRCAPCRRAKQKSSPLSPTRSIEMRPSRASPAAAARLWRRSTYCSSASSVRGCSAFWRSCTLADHAGCLAAARAHSSHAIGWTTISATHERWSVAVAPRSDERVSLSLSRRECGSV